MEVNKLAYQIEVLKESLTDAQEEIFRLRNMNDVLTGKIQFQKDRETEFWKSFGNYCKAVTNQFNKRIEDVNSIDYSISGNTAGDGSHL